MKKIYNIYKNNTRSTLAHLESFYQSSTTEIDVEVFELVDEFETYEKAYEHLENLCENKKTSSIKKEEVYTILECYKF